MPLKTRLRSLLRAAGAGAVLLAAPACEDPFKLEASLPNSDLNFVVWALSDTPDEYPSALQVAQATLVRPDPAGSFDLAFDLNPSGDLVVLPVSSVVTPVLGARSVEFITTDAVFAQILSAPTSGWQRDTLITVGVGEAFLVRVTSSTCTFQFRQEIYAKFEVDSIIVPERRARLRGRVNPNCGFRSFQDGVPEF